MGKAYLVKTMLKRMKEKKDALMQKVRKRMRADMDRILKMCMDLLRKHAVVTIEHRNKLGGFERLKTKKLLMKWHEVAREQVLHRIKAILVIQKCYRGLLGRRVFEMVRVAKQLQLDGEENGRKMNDLDEMMKGKCCACGFGHVVLGVLNRCIEMLHCIITLTTTNTNLVVFFFCRSWTKIRPGDWVAHHHKNHGKIDGFVGRENRSSRCVGQSSENQRQSKWKICVQKTQRQSKKNGQSTVRL